MKKNKYIIATLMLFLLNIQTTHAACTQEEIDAFKKIEDKYTVKYEFNKETKDYKIMINVPLFEQFGFSIDKNMNQIKFESKEGTLYTYSGIQPGEYKIEIIGSTVTCQDVFKTIDLKLAKYNKYSEDPLCEGIEEFVLCSTTYNREIDYETFKSRIETYKKSKLKKETEIKSDTEIEKESDQLDYIINYIKVNLIAIIIIVVFIILLITTIIITAKSIRKSRRLE